MNEVPEDYESPDPSFMAVSAALRYWRKYHPEEVSEISPTRRNRPVYVRLSWFAFPLLILPERSIRHGALSSFHRQLAIGRFAQIPTRVRGPRHIGRGEVFTIGDPGASSFWSRLASSRFPFSRALQFRQLPLQRTQIVAGRGCGPAGSYSFPSVVHCAPVDMGFKLHQLSSQWSCLRCADS